ncbi:MAG: N-acyl homoserine lactonase family protein [Actinomycetota bacterium]|nr:N-acyl homoserine lactonase family protein [Actinomycetota bacterium]
MLEPSNFEVYAVRYATREARSSEHFHGGDPHNAPMPMDYFVWAAISPEHTVVVDAGFTAEVAERRGREHLRCPTEGLGKLGVDCARVPHVVLTHLHYDHIGNLEKFPEATFVVQDEEMAFWTGRHAGRGQFRALVEADDVLHLVRENFEGRLRFVDGDEEILPGIEVFKAGGHSAGLQMVRVRTARGMVVLASDAAHFYRNIDEDRPFSIVTDLTRMYDAFDLARSLTDSSGLIVPGHDPLVMERFPAAREGLEGVAVRIA